MKSSLKESEIEREISYGWLLRHSNCFNVPFVSWVSDFVFKVSSRT